MSADAIVVGAGPAGSSAAYHLASRGRSVILLDRRSFPRDKSCGDGVTRPAARLLAEMGVLDRLPDAWPIRGARIAMTGQGVRTFDYPAEEGDSGHGLTIPRLKLDAAVCAQAVAAGADLREETTATALVREGQLVTGVDVSHAGGAERLTAPIVVVANGAGSRLGRPDGTDASELGYAIRGYYDGVSELEEYLEVHMPLTDDSGLYFLPAYGWAFPVGPGRANIGVGVTRREHQANVRRLMEAFVETLRATDPRFEGMAQSGEWRGAPLRFDFVPERCAEPGLVLVGDAAGMVSPFSGEGISFALESGKLAAETIADALDAGAAAPLDLGPYVSTLRTQYAGYFETGRRMASRHTLVWRVLEGTFDDDGPLFDLIRRAAVFPEAAGQLYPSAVMQDVSGVLGSERTRLQLDSLGLGEVLIEATRKDWPHLAQLFVAGGGDPGIPFRPALLVMLAAGFGDPTRPEVPLLAGAVELGSLAAVAQASVGGRRIASDKRDWGTIFALMLSDFLLAKAMEVTGSADPEATVVIAESVAGMCEARMKQITAAAGPDGSIELHERLLGETTGELFALACRVGARAAAADAGATAALEAYGRELGTAYQVAEDCRKLAGVPTLFGQPAERASGGSTNTVTRLGGDAGRAEELARDHAARARAALEPLPEGGLREALGRLADYVVTAGEGGRVAK